MARLAFQLLATFIIAAFLGCLLWALGQEFLTLAYLCRVPLIAAMLLGVLALATIWPLPSMFGGMVRVDLARMIPACVATTLATMSIAKTTAMVLEYGVDRYGFRDLTPGLASPWLAFWFWNCSPTIWQVVFAGGLLVSLAIHGPDPRRRNIFTLFGRAAVAAATVAATIVVVELSTPWLYEAIRELANATLRIPAFVQDGLGPGYFEAGTGLPSEGHLQSTTFLAFALGVYAIGYFILNPRRTNPTALRMQSAVPPIFYVLLLLTLGVWLLTGITFFLDYWRFPSLLAVGLFSFLAYRWFLFDHYYTTCPVAPSTALDGADRAAGVASGVAGCKQRALPVAQTFRYVQEPTETAIRANPLESNDRSFMGAAAVRKPDPAAIDEKRWTRLAAQDCLVVVAACGGGILAAAWCVHALTRLFQRFDRLEQATGLISAVSGGSLGALYLVDEMLADGGAGDDAADRWARANEAVRRSTLEATLWGIVYPGFLRGLLPALVYDRRYDHGWATETGWMARMARPNLTLRQVAQAFRDGHCPQLILNAVCVENGRRFLFSSGTEQLDSVAAHQFQRLDFFSEYRDRDIPLATAARMSATFPYISPIARIDVAPDQPAVHLADGGYFDNSGVFSAIEWIRWQMEKPGSMLKARGVGRILLLRLSIQAPQLAASGTRVGWLNAILGPLLTMMNVRGTSQAEHVEQELQLFTTWCSAKHDVALSDVAVEYAGSGPMSWEMNPADIAALESHWERDYEQPIEMLARGQSIDAHNAHHRSIEKLATLFNLRE